jgi:hypothetical protein
MFKFMQRLNRREDSAKEEEEECVEMLERITDGDFPCRPPPDPVAVLICGDLYQRCREWVCEQWSTPASPIISIHLNPGVLGWVETNNLALLPMKTILHPS